MKNTNEDARKSEMKKAAEFMALYLGGNPNTSSLTPFAIQEMMIAFSQSLSEQPESKPTESEQVEKLKAAIESALRIENLWLPSKITSFGPFSNEHIALGNMKKLFLEALNSLKQ